MPDVDVPESAQSSKSDSPSDVVTIGEDIKDAGEARHRLRELHEELKRLEQKDQLARKLGDLRDRLDALTKDGRAASTEELGRRLEPLKQLCGELKACVEERDEVVRRAMAGARASTRTSGPAGRCT